MKKRIYVFMLMTVVSSIFTACEDELNPSPQQSLTEEDAFADKKAAESTLMGVYSTAQVLEAYGSMPQLISEFMSDNVSFVGSFPTLQEIRDFNTISTNGNVSGIWQQHYRIILRANAVIANVPKVQDATFTDAERRQFIAEAKFMRALGYFQLVSLFAQPYQIQNGAAPGVPVVLEPFTGTVTYPAKSSVNEVHAQIVKDLTEAIPDLLDSFSTPEFTRGRATKGAARALLSRLHLYRGEWTSAASFAKQVLDASSLYSLAANYAFYDDNTSEDVFTIQNSAIDNGRTGSGGWASYYQPAALGGRGDAPFSQSLINAYNEEPGDRRFELKITGVAADNATSFFTSKFPDAVTNADNAPVIRTTEVVLNYVEASAEAAGAVTQEHIDLMNQLRTRAGLSPWTLATFASKNAFITAVLNERRKELAFEGHRRMDLLRRQQNLRPSEPKAVFGGVKTILPIPQRELDNNPSLTPNE